MCLKALDGDQDALNFFRGKKSSYKLKDNDTREGEEYKIFESDNVRVYINICFLFLVMLIFFSLEISPAK